jgi:hypothetical protein
MVFIDTGENDGINRAGLLAKSAVDAFEQIYVIADGSSGAIPTLFRLNGNRESGTDRLTEFAGDTTFFPIRIASEGMEPTKTR